MYGRAAQLDKTQSHKPNNNNNLFYHYNHNQCHLFAPLGPHIPHHISNISTFKTLIPHSPPFFRLSLMQVNERMKNRYQLPEKRWYLWVLAILGIIGASLFITSLIQTSENSNSNFLCSLTKTQQRFTTTDNNSPTSMQLKAILHYATSQIVPQQSLSEISVTFNVLQSLHRPANFLVFGLGHDSLMWASLNPHGTTLFLEEDPKWVQTVLKDAPGLRAHTVRYRTQLREADNLLSSYRSEPACSPATAGIRGNERCRLALHNLPDEVYDTEWDLVMIDAPRGYFPEAPGRMAAIFSVAVMARERKGSGVTHVFLHDVDRKVEKVYAEEILCRKYLVKGVGRLWHFEIPSKVNRTIHHDRFC